MDFDIGSVARSAVQSMQAYQPGKPIEEAQRELGIASFVKLASNENPRGPSENVLQAAAGAMRELHRYPDANGYYLKRQLSERHSVPIDSITLGCGSNDLLEMVASAFLDHKASAIYSQYGFLVYGLAIARTAAKPIVVPAVNYAHNLAAFAEPLDEATRVVYIANPNNPTGTYATSEALQSLLEKVPASVIVVLDEAYFEYIDKPDYPNGCELLSRYPNLVVTRTFSKAYGLSGLRVGYAVSHPDVADMLNRVRQPFNVSNIALAAACAALQDERYLSESVELNRQGMQQFEAAFRRLDIDYIPSVANFITIKVPGDAAELNTQLLQRGIIVRPVGNYDLPQHLRISIGLECENTALIDALASIYSQQGGQLK